MINLSKIKKILNVHKAFQFILRIIPIGLLFLLSGCQSVLLNPKGMIAERELYILVVTTLLMLIIVVPVILLIFWVCWRYREGNRHATYAPEWSHSTRLEVICWTIPCVIIAVLGVITWVSSHRLDPYRPLDVKGKTLTIQAIALEWKWLFIYPEENVASVNFIHLPVGVPVKFLISAEGPMNSFQIPHLAGQIYAMAGMQTKLHLIANTVGTYPGVSANFSGEGFSDMNFKVKVGTAEEFNQWIQAAKKSSQALTMESYNELIKPSKSEAVKYFSPADKSLFNTVVMKSMMPMNTHDHTMTH